MFFVVIDSVIAGLTTRYEAAKEINDHFSFSWSYMSLSDEEIDMKSISVVQIYYCDIGRELADEMKFLKSIHEANYGTKPLGPIDFLYNLHNKHHSFQIVVLLFGYFVLLQLLLLLLSNLSAS